MKRSGSSIAVAVLAAVVVVVATMSASAVLASSSCESAKVVAARQLVDAYTKSNKPADKQFSEALFELAEDALRSDPEKAWSLFEKSVQSIKQAADADARDVAWKLEVVALRKQSAGKLVEAEKLFSEAASIFEKNYAGRTNQLLYNRYLRNYLYQYRYADAGPVFWKAFKAWELHAATDEKLDIVDTIFIADSANDIGTALVIASKYNAAEPYLAKAVELRTRMANLYGKKDDVRSKPWIDVATSLTASGRSLIGQKRYQEARVKLADAQRYNQQSKLQTFSWNHVDNNEAIGLLNKHAGAKFALKPVQTSFGKTDQLQGEAGFWQIKYQSAERLGRESCWCWWDHNDSGRFLNSAEQDAKSLHRTDPRSILTMFAQAEELKDNSKQQSKCVPELMSLALTNESLGAQLIKQLLDDTDRGYCRVNLLQSILDSKASEELPAGLSKYIAARFMTELRTCGWSDRAISKSVLKNMIFLQKGLGENNSEIIDALPEVAHELEMDLKYYDAMMVYRRLVSAYKVRYGPKSAKVKEALIKYADLLFMTNDKEGANKAAAEAAAM